MSSPDENINPHSLPNLSILLSNSAHKRNNKHGVHNGSSAASGPRQSVLANISLEDELVPVTYIDEQLPTPPSSQSMDPTQDNVVDELRLPISPPPEEEIRVKELSHTQKPKNQLRLQASARGAPSAPFKFPSAPQSFAQYQQCVHQPSDREPLSSTSVGNGPSPSDNNPRKRARSTIPPPATPASVSSASAPPSSKAHPTLPTTTPVAQSPNPKPRKQPKVHDSGVYTGSGFKRRHTRGTSSESLRADNDPLQAMPPSQTFKSPARKKRTKDPGVEDYTPQRERTCPGGASAKQKSRPRRSAAIDVPYEPPTEQFTPPRHVVLPPPSSTTSMRSRKPRQSSLQLNLSVERKVVRVKPERLTSPFPPPLIDLSRPTAPPSPTDDPILLIGPQIPSQSDGGLTKTLIDAAVGGDDLGVTRHQYNPKASTPVQPSRLSADESAWCMAPNAGEETALLNVDFDGPSQFDATFDPASDSESDGEVPVKPTLLHGRSPRLDPDLSTGSHIFHSDDDEAVEAGEDEGEYTGLFKFYSVPVKEDPPSSATRGRRESWGRPISPFPFQKRRNVPQVGRQDADGDRTQEVFDEESPPPSPSDGRRRLRKTGAMDSTHRTHRTGGFTLSEMEAKLEARNAIKQAPAQQSEEEYLGTEVTDPAIHLIETTESDDVNVRVVDGHAQEDPNDDEENDGRNITPMEQFTHMFDEAELSEVEDEGDPNAAVSIQEGHSRSVIEVEIDKGGGGQDRKEEQVQLPVSSHQGSVSQTILDPSVAKLTEHFVAPLNKTDDSSALLTNSYDDGDSSDEDLVSNGVVEISSDDPKAAARAAAILKLHHSYILDGVAAQNSHRASPLAYSRRRSFASGNGNCPSDTDNQDMLRRARRKGIAISGGVLQYRPHQISRSPLAHSGIAIPGSPAGSVTSAEDALREAETEICVTNVSPDALRTPLRSRLFGVESLQRRSASPPVVSQLGTSIHTANPREWSKSDWKMLDVCFTDERIAVANAVGVGTLMADVDDVRIDAVVNRFLGTAQEKWDRDMLFRRVKALSSRQRAGQGAPPSPGQSNGIRSTTELIVPTLTPPVVRRTFVPPPDILAPTKLPPSLLAPRYAHLHEEAVASTVEQSSLSSSGSKIPDGETCAQKDEGSFPASRIRAEPSTPQITREVDSAQSNDGVTSAAPASATKRVLNYLGSILGRGPTKSTKPVLQTQVNALPLPPPEMRQTARGPVSTPAKKPIPKPRAPRDLVQLAQTQLPSRPPVPPIAQSAKDMVNLHHVDPPRSAQRPRTASVPIVISRRARKDSGGSVKDLVRSFEEVHKKTEEEMARSSVPRGNTAIRKVASAGNLKGGALWRP